MGFDNKEENHVTFTGECDNCIHEDICRYRPHIVKLRDEIMKNAKKIMAFDNDIHDAIGDISSLDVEIHHKCDKYHAKPCEMAITGTQVTYAAGGNCNTNLGRPTYSSHNVGGSIRAGDGGFDLGLPLPQGYSRPVPMYVKPCTTSNIDRKPF